MAAGGAGHCCLDARETFNDVGEAAIEIVAVGRHGDGFGHRFVAAHGGETEVRPARVEGHYDSFVVAGIHGEFFLLDWNLAD